MDADLRIAIIGYGLAGRVFHAPLIDATPGLAVAAIVTGDPARRGQAALAHPHATLLAGPDELWAQAGAFDGVVIAAPSGAHAALTAAALEARLPTVVDKPLAASSAQAQELVAQAERAGVLLTVFQNRRWDTDQLLLNRLLADHVLGTVFRCESRIERWRPQPRDGSWREHTDPAEGGGQLLDLGSHLVDQVLQAFGPVAHVYAEVADRRHAGADDDDFVALTHRDGVISHLRASAMTAAPAPRLRVLGTEGALVVPAVDGQEDALRAGERPGSAGWGGTPEHARPRLVSGEQSVPLTPPPGDWPRFYARWRDALRGDGPPPVDPHDAVTALRVIEAARLSAAERRVVEL